MGKSKTDRRLGLPRLVLSAMVAACVAWPGWSQVVEVIEEPGDWLVEVEDAADAEADLSLTNLGPGFMLTLADEDLQKQVAELDQFLAANDWGQAFRLLTEFDGDQLQVLVPIGNSGQHISIKEQLQRQLLALPPDGLRAFRLYFDGQASEQLDAVKNHPLPGSEAQLSLAQTLVDRYLASSVGGEAAVLLGDLYFERGLFRRAQRYWQLALERGFATGQAALRLQAKLTLAMHRGGDQAGASALFEELQARYGQSTMEVGGRDVDVIAMLRQTLGQVEQADTKPDLAVAAQDLLPGREAMPAWHLRFLDQAGQNAIHQSLNRRSYYSPPNDLAKFVPPVVADPQRVYFHWLGVVFALDRQTGKIAWHQGSISDAAEQIPTRIQFRHGDPRNYRIAQSPDVLLVTSTLDSNRDSPFVLSAYDKANGHIRWRSDGRQDWPLPAPGTLDQGNTQTSLLGEVLVADGWGYAVVHRTEQTDCYLRRFDPATGEVDWTLSLGGADPITFQHTRVSRMPQPSLVMGQSLLYVMTNNGALLAVDVVSSEVRWALRMDPPFGVGHTSPQQGFVRGNQLGNQIEALANTNGSGRLLLQDGVLYAKEHNSKSLYALDADSGQVAWSADRLKPDAKLMGVDDQRFYLMDQAVQSYAVEPNHDLITKNGAQTGNPDDAGAIVGDEKILLYGNGKLRLLDTTDLDPAGQYENADYLGIRGGHLYHLGDLLIAIDTTQITAFKIQSHGNE